MDTPRILDCTLRDGGYYNHWCYSRDLVESYLRAVDDAGVDIIEMGFRNFPQAAFLGPYAYSTDAFLRSLPLPARAEIAVMVDGKALLRTGAQPAAAVDALFAPRSESPVGWVRVAAHFEEIPRCAPVAARLRELGYRVGLNLMQSAGKVAAEIAALAALVQSWGTVDVLYFADSLGSMDADEVRRVYAAIASRWSGPVGMHAHNNKSLAVQNTLVALDAGAGYADATVLGMGRGAGNAELEILLCELEARGMRAARLDALAALCEEHFRPLHERYKWGASFFYHYSALHEIHPMFAQTLIADRRYSAREKLAALRALADKESTSFSRLEIERSLNSFADDRPLDANAPAADLGVFDGAEVMLVGAGPSVRQYAPDIEMFIREHAPLVLTLNHQAAIDSSLVDGIICVDRYRLISECAYLATCGKPIYSSRRFQDDLTRERLTGADLREYDCRLELGRFSALANGCVIPVPLAFAYALGLCLAGGVRRIFLVGFDGFDSDDSRQGEMLQLLRAVESEFRQIAMTALTPTSYPVAQGSIYASYR
jgi:4-hydroxy 2-oxovalerate aldolase